MKTMRFLSTVLALAITAIVSAVEKPKMNVQPLNSDRVLVTVQNKSADDVEMSIQNESGDVVFYKYCSKPGLSVNTILDVNQMVNGDYKLKIVMNGKILESDLTIASKQIKTGEIKESLAPYFMYNGKDIIITQLNFEKENYKFEIYDENGLVYQKTIGNESLIHAGFDLSKLKSGSYEVALNSANNHFTYQFEKIDKGLACK